MAKSKKKHDKGALRQSASSPSESRVDAGADAVCGCGAGHDGPVGKTAEDGSGALGADAVEVRPAEEPDATTAPVRVVPVSRLRRALPDIVKVALAFAFIGVAAVIWYKPPLVIADYPRVTYRYNGVWLDDAKLYRPLAMPTRYYVGLPLELAGRYEWFAVDRRREVVALTEEPSRRFMGRKAIKRGDPLGLDLEFRKIDGSEWQVFFFEESIVFSNAVLAVRLDAGKGNGK
ncbi:MAG: hypothetical protein PHU80_02770 [Kiritimatiellae bacterium]|nr:hypothetical protein [Kiritimatiellia bacterium]